MPSSAATPRVSLGLPVYNGKTLIAATIDSILAQDFTDFELIISDNGSTDGTLDVCREYAARDQRILLLEGGRNVGATRNFNRVFEFARAPYFKWAAHDDRYEPAFLTRCVAALDTDPGAVLAYTAAVDIDPASGEVFGPVDYEVGTDRSDPVERLAEVLMRPHPCFQIFGVIRSDVLAQGPLIGSYSGSDRVLLAEIALHGRFVEIPERLFLHGEHEDRSVNAHLYEHDRYAWFDPRLEGKTAYPYWRLVREARATLGRAPLTRSQRRRALQTLAQFGNRHKVDLARDVARPLRRWLSRV